MPELTFEELYAQLQGAEQRSTAHDELIQAIDALHQASLPFRRFQNRKKLPLVKERDKTRLMALHQQIGVKAEKLLAGEERPELKDMVKKIAALSSRNYNALLQYNPDKGQKTLDSLEEESRTLILHVGEEEFGKAKNLGGNLSERMPLALYDDNGKKISGLFTKKNTLEVQAPFYKALEEAGEAQEPKDKEAAKRAFQYLKDAIDMPIKLQHPNGKEEVELTSDPAQNIYELLRLSTVQGQNGKKKIDNLNLYSTIRQFLPKNVAANFKPEMCFALTEQLDPIRTPISINLGDAKISEGSRLDSRNSAMSAVADLLGMPRIVARSRPMKIVDTNGNEIEGTFMELARGVDVNNMSDLAEYIDESALEESTGLGFRDIANLQVLDYICGNVDRHGGNMAYQFDPATKFYGVQGFDNDCSFGTLVPKSGDGKNRMVGTKKMRAIPAATYVRVMQLTPSTLKYALRGFGLSEEQLDAAGKRLQQLQNDLLKEKEYFQKQDRTYGRPRGRLKSGHTRILQENEWKDYDEEEFYREGDDNSIKNAYSAAATCISKMSDRYDKLQAEYNDLSKTIAAGIQNRAYKSTAAREEKKAAGLKSILSKRTWRAFTSQNYRDMEEAVKNYMQAQKQLKERLKAANSEDAKRRSNYHGEMDAVVTRDDLGRLRQLSDRMKETARKYLDGKLVNGKPPQNASDYTKRRIEIAKRVLDYGEQGAEIRAEETLKAKANEAQATQQIAHRKSIQGTEVPTAPEIPRIPRL